MDSGGKNRSVVSRLLAPARWFDNLQQGFPEEWRKSELGRVCCRCATWCGAAAWPAMAVTTAALLKQPHGRLLPMAFSCTLALFVGAVFSAGVAILAPQDEPALK